MKSKIKKFFKFLVIFIVLLGLGLAGTVYYIDKYLWNNVYTNDVQTSQKSHGVFNTVKHMVSNKPYTVLITGVDGTNIKDGRTDTIIIATVNPKTNKISMLSIPRDTRLYIAKKQRYDKINAAYVYGGIEETINTLSKTFDIPINYYATVDFTGLQKAVDLLGGVEINVEEDMTFPDRITHTQFTLHKGVQKLNGIQALNYARFRYDAEGDFGRNRRQQQVVKAILKETMSLKNASKIKELFEAMGDHAKTNLSFDEIVAKSVKMGGSVDHIETIKMKAYPQNISGISYVVVDDNEIEKAKTQLQEELK